MAPMLARPKMREQTECGGRSRAEAARWKQKESNQEYRNPGKNSGSCAARLRQTMAGQAEITDYQSVQDPTNYLHRKIELSQPFIENETLVS
jgi:hypothetical protein